MHPNRITHAVKSTLSSSLALALTVALLCASTQVHASAASPTLPTDIVNRSACISTHNEGSELCEKPVGDVIRSSAKGGDVNVPSVPPALEKVTSFDIFDTLLARRVYHPEAVFDLVEAKVGLPGFGQLRRSVWGSWSDIYDRIQSALNCSREVREYIEEQEILTELEVAVPIYANIARLEPSSIIVSDMYLPKSVILRMLHAVGVYHDEERVFVSRYGKGEGWMWSMLKQRFDIVLHVGDNAHGDVRMAREYGLTAELSEAHVLNSAEAALASVDGYFGVALALREFRLSQPAPRSRIAAAQLEGNLIVLVHMASVIAGIVESEGLDTVLLATRDCALLEIVLSALYPKVHWVRFHSSRYMFGHPTAAYEEYVKRLYVPGKTLIFDIHGLFWTPRAFFLRLFGSLPRVHIYLFPLSSSPESLFSSVSGTFDGGIDYLENINTDVVGSLIGFEYGLDGGYVPIRGPLSPSLRREIQEGHRVVKSFAGFARQHREVFTAPKWFGDRALENGMSRIFDVMTLFSAGAQDFKYAFEHSRLHHLAHTFGSDRGPGGHGYTVVYERLLYELEAKSGFRDIRLLEVGVSVASGSDSKMWMYSPSLSMWSVYLASVVIGFDIDHRVDSTPTEKWLRYASEMDPAGRVILHGKDNPARTIGIVGNQSVPSDLAQCAQHGPYHIIIDDGSHVSRDQQVSLLHLWSLLAPGGVYVIEDLHETVTGERDVSTVEMLRRWSHGSPFPTRVIGLGAAVSMLSEVEEIVFHESQWNGTETESETAKQRVKSTLAVLKKRTLL